MFAFSVVVKRAYVESINTERFSSNDRIPQFRTTITRQSTRDIVIGSSKDPTIDKSRLALTGRAWCRPGSHCADYKKHPSLPSKAHIDSLSTSAEQENYVRRQKPWSTLRLRRRFPYKGLPAFAVDRLPRKKGAGGYCLLKMTRIANSYREFEFRERFTHCGTPKCSHPFDLVQLLDWTHRKSVPYIQASSSSPLEVNMD
ncbi:uncharacterized protein RAG0_09360 [Rhynchosporium agropyri]|uniref:Uncharacterized protein n=1 Tax=Rhynchosporium agropyri TaxID=914238 RepID=A0A1E1KV74_9HELO|nr:uncharacterized protein RAG0_09360 [Rhynchosporium agropyri]